MLIIFGGALHLVTVPKSLKEKWVSIRYQITDQRSWENHDIFDPCDHPDLRFDERRKWLQVGSSVYIALEKIITDRTLLNDVRYLCDLGLRGNLEVFHSLKTSFVQNRCISVCMLWYVEPWLQYLIISAGSVYRKLQHPTMTWGLSKSFHGFLPLFGVLKRLSLKTRHYIQEILEEVFFQ